MTHAAAAPHTEMGLSVASLSGVDAGWRTFTMATTKAGWMQAPSLAAAVTGGIAGPLQSREDSLKRCSTTGSFGEKLHDFSPAGRANGSSTQRYGLISGQIRTNQNWMLSLACPKIPACDKPG